MSVMLLISCAIAVVIGLVSGWFFSHIKKQPRIDALVAELNEQKLHAAILTERIQQLDTLQTQINQRDTTIAELNQTLSQYEHTITELKTTQLKDKQFSDEKLALLEDAKQKLSNEFKLLANQIFEEKSKVFSQQNRTGMDEILKPMREQMHDFRKRVDEIHTDDSKDRASLREYLTQLKDLNQQMSADAIHLTHALKGDSKAQGNWGEMILERLLEASGLSEERGEFTREQSFTNQDGTRLRPDVVIYMPGDKQVIIDSKVSLTDYERAISAADDATQEKSIHAHLRSLKQHIQSLSGKNYDHLPHVHSPDYVLLFIPVEGAYLMAIEADQRIFEFAFDQRVAVVTPSTLYATLKLIEHLWRYERQSENVAKLINRAGRLHDKMVDFVKAFEEIGGRLNQAQNAYDTAMGRMTSGAGNVIAQIDTLGKLAGKTKKELPAHILDASTDTDQEHLP